MPHIVQCNWFFFLLLECSIFLFISFTAAIAGRHTKKFCAFDSIRLMLHKQSLLHTTQTWAMPAAKPASPSTIQRWSHALLEISIWNAVFSYQKIVHIRDYVYSLCMYVSLCFCYCFHYVRQQKNSIFSCIGRLVGRPVRDLISNFLCLPSTIHLSIFFLFSFFSQHMLRIEAMADATVYLYYVTINCRISESLCLTLYFQCPSKIENNSLRRQYRAKPWRMCECMFSIVSLAECES